MGIGAGLTWGKTVITAELGHAIKAANRVYGNTGGVAASGIRLEGFPSALPTGMRASVERLLLRRVRGDEVMLQRGVVELVNLDDGLVGGAGVSVSDPLTTTPLKGGSKDGKSSPEAELAIGTDVLLPSSGAMGVIRNCRIPKNGPGTPIVAERSSVGAPAPGAWMTLAVELPGT